MRRIGRLSGWAALILLLAVFGLGLQAMRPPAAWSQQSDAGAALQAFNRAALRGDLDGAGRLMSSRLLRSTSFFERQRTDPARLAEEVRLMTFYQVVQEEPLPGPNARIKVVQQKLVGGQGLVTRWYYMVQEGGAWKLDRVDQEMPYR